MRITSKHVEAKVSIVNGMLGIVDPAYNTVGAIQLYSAYGGYGIHRVANDSHGVSELAGLGTLKEASSFLSGMIAALRIAADETA